MTSPNSPYTPQTSLEASISKLSLSSNGVEDWDTSMVEKVEEQPQAPPATPPRPELQAEAADVLEDTPNAARERRSLAELLRLHTENGKDLRLSDEDEETLTEELGQWINSDFSPYEPEDDFFARRSSLDGQTLTKRASNGSPDSLTINGRPRGHSEVALNRPSSVPPTRG